MIESSAILSAYGEEIDLYHVGSTAVKGLDAKDCIDILGVVNDIGEVKSKIETMAHIGYKYKGNFGISGREYFSKRKRKAHLHIFEKGSTEIIKHLNFVKVMNSNPPLVLKLNKLKCHLHRMYPNDKERYQKQKAYFYNEIHKTL